MIMLKDLSIKHKLVLIIFSTALVSVIAGFSIVIAAEYRALREKVVHDALLNTKLVGEYCITPLDFGYNEEAESILAKLESVPAVQKAVLFDNQGESFAMYNRRQSLSEIPFIPDHKTESIFDGQWLHIFRPISFNGRNMGTLYLLMSTVSFYKELGTLCITLSGIVLTMIVIIYFLALKMQSIISKPILQLADISEQISINGDYTVHLQPIGRDEIGTLYTNFNNMLRKIQSRTHELKNEITERKRAEEARIRLESAIEQATDSIIITDREGIIQYVNPSFEQLTGYSNKEVIGKNPRLLKSGQHEDIFYKEMWETLSRGETWKGHLINKKKDGSLFEEEAVINPVYDTNRELANYVAVKRDVTEQIKTFQLLQQAQEMEAIGTLAGGIAHDFNNILMAILGYGEMVLAELPENSVIWESQQQVVQAGMRAQQLVKQILAFSRKSEHELQTVHPYLVAREVTSLLRSTIPATIEIRENIQKEGKVLADPTELHQILMNLCTNAYHAMRKKGGILSIAVVPVEITEEESKSISFDMHPGKFIKIEVSDTGHGITNDIMGKIFDPYFTTKKKGEGTGLGLATVHGIVKKYGGEISVCSEVDSGTTFNIFLPEAVGEAGVTGKESAEPLPRGDESILVVDDDEIIVIMIERMLSNLGYKVMTFTDSTEALKSFVLNSNKYDLIITDMTMPQMTGFELAKMIFAIRKDIPIILNTGFSENVSEEKAKSIGIKKFFMKPLKVKDLAFSVREMLDDLRMNKK